MSIFFTDCNKFGHARELLETRILLPAKTNPCPVPGETSPQTLSFLRALAALREVGRLNTFHVFWDIPGLTGAAWFRLLFFATNAFRTVEQSLKDVLSRREEGFF